MTTPKRRSNNKGAYDGWSAQIEIIDSTYSQFNSTILRSMAYFSTHITIGKFMSSEKRDISWTLARHQNSWRMKSRTCLKVPKIMQKTASRKLKIRLQQCHPNLTLHNSFCKNHHWAMINTKFSNKHALICSISMNFCKLRNSFATSSLSLHAFCSLEILKRFCKWERFKINRLCQSIRSSLNKKRIYSQTSSPQFCLGMFLEALMRTFTVISLLKIPRDLFTCQLPINFLITSTW